jgi:hypothetical protein
MALVAATTSSLVLVTASALLLIVYAPPLLLATLVLLVAALAHAGRGRQSWRDPLTRLLAGAGIAAIVTMAFVLVLFLWLEATE